MRGETAKPDEGGVVRLTGNDQMRFNATRIEVPAGKVKIELKNVGALPKEAMGHNLVVLKAGANPMGFAASAVGAKDAEYVPAGSADVLGHTHREAVGPIRRGQPALRRASGSWPCRGWPLGPAPPPRR